MTKVEEEHRYQLTVNRSRILGEIDRRIIVENLVWAAGQTASISTLYVPVTSNVSQIKVDGGGR